MIASIDDLRPSVLMVVSSSCQLYSGTGTALFDWMRFARDALDFTLLIDTGERPNFEIAARFCRDQGIRLCPSRPEQLPGCPDLYASSIAAVLRSRSWDYVECISWANAATNLQVLSNRSPSSNLLFTPHTQPIWTLPTPDRYFMVQHMLGSMLRVSDLVFVDTPRELAHIDADTLDPTRVSFVPLGVNTTRFRPASGPAAENSARHILSVADFREHRKRPDLLLQAFETISGIDRSLELVLAGKGSQHVHLRPAIEKRVTRLGYIGADDLLNRYRSSRAFVLLSDFEAFGLPIAEALCCGTPVITTRQEQTADIFGDLPGVYLVDNADPAAVSAAVLAACANAPDRQRISAAASERFGHDQTYARKLAHVLALRTPLTIDQ